MPESVRESDTYATSVIEDCRVACTLELKKSTYSLKGEGMTILTFQAATRMRGVRQVRSGTVHFYPFPALVIDQGKSHHFVGFLIILKGKVLTFEKSVELKRLDPRWFTSSYHGLLNGGRIK